MKKGIILISIVLALLSCTIEQEQPAPMVDQVTIRAYQEGAGGTKTTVVDGGTQVYWEVGEVINVFFKGNGGRFVSQNTNLAEVANFAGSFYGLVGANEGAGSSNIIWGLYPYRSDATSDGPSVTTTLPDLQTARAGSFATKSHISLACSHSLDLAFYNVTGGFRFSVTQEGIKSITFEGNNGETLAGKIKLAFSDGIPIVQEVVEGKTSITLKAQSGTTLQTGEWYYLSALPGSLPNGFTITFNTADKSAKLVSNGAVSFKRGIYGSLANADDGLVFKGAGDDVDPVSPDEIISFADDKVKAKLVAAFDSNHDGEISYAEAAAATSMEGVFGAIKTYKSFDEFQYFTGITEVPGGMCKGWNLLSSITLPNSLTIIGSYAFQNCIKCTEFTIPNSVQSIGDYAFNNCTSLASIVIPESVTSIWECAFSGCTSLTSIIIPEKVTRIGIGAFSGCTSLASIVIPEGVTSIVHSAFQNCTSLASIVIPESVTSIGEYAFSGCTSLASIVIPESVISIWKYAFSGCASLTSIVIPESVTSIGSGAFSGCTSLASIVTPFGYLPGIEETNRSCLKSIIILDGVTSIGYSAFQNCTSLATIVIPESVTSIGNSAFSGCTSLISIVIPESVTSIGSSVFSGCTSLTSIVIPEGVTSIDQAFSGCTSLTSIVIPESVTIIGYGAFSGCTSLTSIVIPESVTSIWEYAFSGCTSLTTIVIPESVSYIGDGAFSGCTSMTSIVIPESVTSIGEYALFGCTNLTSIVIPESVSYIGSGAFQYCTAMTSCTLFADKPPLIGPYAFSKNTCIIYVPSGSVETYKTANDWSEYASRIFAITE